MTDRPSEEEQNAALAAAGIDDFGPYGPVHRDVPKGQRPRPDDLRWRADMLQLVQAGDVVEVLAPACLGLTPKDVGEVAAKILGKGASIRFFESGETLAPPPTDEKIGPLRELMVRFQRNVHQRRWRDKTQPKKKRLEGAVLEAVRKDWANPKLTIAKIAKKHGFSASQLNQKLGPRWKPKD